MSHSRYNHDDDCKKSIEKPGEKIIGSEVTFVHNCVGSSSGKKSIPTAREQIKLSDSKISRH